MYRGDFQQRGHFRVSVDFAFTTIICLRCPFIYHSYGLIVVEHAKFQTPSCALPKSTYVPLEFRIHNCRKSHQGERIFHLSVFRRSGDRYIPLPNLSVSRMGEVRWETAQLSGKGQFIAQRIMGESPKCLAIQWGDGSFFACSGKVPNVTIGNGLVRYLNQSWLCRLNSKFAQQAFNIYGGILEGYTEITRCVRNIRNREIHGGDYCRSPMRILPRVFYILLCPRGW